MGLINKTTAAISSCLMVFTLLLLGPLATEAHAEDCTPADLANTFYDDYYAGTKWTSPGVQRTITWSASASVINDEQITRMPTADELNTIRAGIDSWDLELDSIKFSEVTTTTADLVIGWVPMASAPNQSNAIGYWNAWWNSSDLIRYRATIKLKDVSEISTNTNALLHAVQHEVGNVLGLGDIMPNSAFVSVQEDPWSLADTQKVLSDYDVRMIRTLYSESTCTSTFHQYLTTQKPTPEPTPTIDLLKAGLNKKYKNCAALNAIYKGGIGKTARVVNKGSKTKVAYYAHNATYKLNASLDRDKDGIACER